MRFAFTEEQDELRRQARSLLEEREPTWEELAELGWLGVSVPEEAGGAGLGFVEEAVLFEELGRALYPGPYLGTSATQNASPCGRAWRRGPLPVRDQTGARGGTREGRTRRATLEAAWHIVWA